MYVDLPEFKRCCFCIPLRGGLLAWGYFKLIISLLIFGILGSVLPYERKTTFTLCFEITLIIAFALEIGFTISFIVASHQKNYKLLKYYYYYSGVVFVLASTALLISIGLNIYLAIQKCDYCFQSIFYMFILVAGIIIKLLFIVLQFYMILLVRSEIIKLKSNVQFKFVNIKNGESVIATENQDKVEKVKYDRFESEDSSVYNKCEV